MSLPALLKHVYNYGTEEVIKRGKKIFHTHGVSMLDQDAFLEQIRFRVRNDIYQNYYTVTVQHFQDPKRLNIRCQCPYNLGEICRHEVAALFFLNDMLQAGYIAGKDIVYDQSHTVVRMRQPTIQLVQLFAGDDNYKKARHEIDREQIKITATKSGGVEAEVISNNLSFPVKIKLNEERYFDTSCTCNHNAHPLCEHKAALFLMIIEQNQYDTLFGQSNMDRLKNLLLKQYGYSLEDDLKGKFAFSYKDGKPFLRVLDPSLKKVESTASKPLPVPVAVETLEPKKPKVQRSAGLVFQINRTAFPFVQWFLISGNTDEDKAGFKGEVSVFQFQNAVFSGTEKEELLAQTIKKMQAEEVLKYVRKNIPFGEFYDKPEEIFHEQPLPEVVKETWSYLLPKLHLLSKRFAWQERVFYTSSEVIHLKDLIPISISDKHARAVVYLSKVNDVYQAELRIELGLEQIPYDKVERWNDALYLQDEVLYSIKSEEELEAIGWFQQKAVVQFSRDEWAIFLKEKVLEWNHNIKMELDENVLQQQKNTKPGLRLYMEEYDRNMILRPLFVYHDSEIAPGPNTDVLYEKDGKLFQTVRNFAQEEKWMHYLRNSHSEIRFSNERKVFILSEHLVLHNNWLQRFTEEISRQEDVEIIGAQHLQKFKYSTAKPITELRISSGIDWLDTKLSVRFGEEEVSAATIRTALLQKQHYVRLKDGTLGMLPQEWVNKYALMLKMAEVKDGALRLKKVHYNIIDELLAEQDEEEQEIILEEKKEKLLEVVDEGIQDDPIPENLNASLRPYQIDGVKWLQFLRQSGWGGILADDMGLGKTIQALTSFLALKNNNEHAKMLVVCPTTLVYNWQNEVEKFTPDLRFHLHHGPKRSNIKNILPETDVLITTYGTMRSDIKQFKDIELDYIVLDESQAIKNPQSQVAKAALLLQAKNKVALSGTPLQNNTFDLYAQMNFLNPGMLGSREFFMQQFATPIDKFQEEDIKQQLRKLVYPFILRRTKEQVARDLPQKSEITLYCEMGKAQRKVYETYRDMYRQEIIGMIDQQGMDRSRFHILQGLTKLRQICDAPSILKGTEELTAESVKLEELKRELQDNIGDHKALVFSQFLGMLALVRNTLDELGIQYAYFDGSSNLAEREKNIKMFQENEDCKVFLISLKAGGVGLNLTAADYVYIVDPWWNPAVEQQAIDRTHRIGQTKNIFAYRLICKDTIEEKMLKLQERKKILAEDLVGDDGAALKSLNRDDIIYLLT